MASHFQGCGLVAELRARVIERSRVIPVRRPARPGRSLRDTVPLLFAIRPALPLDLLVAIGNRLLTYLMIALIPLMTSADSHGVASTTKSADAPAR